MANGNGEFTNGIVKNWQLLSALAIFLIGWGSIHTQVSSLELQINELQIEISKGVLPRADERITSLEREVSELHAEIRSRTQDRFTGKDGERLEKYLSDKIDNLEKKIK